MKQLTNQQILESIKIRLVDDKNNGARTYIATSSIRPEAEFTMYANIDVDNTKRVIKLFFNYLRSKC